MIYGLTEQDLRGAPAFVDVIDAFDRFIGDKVVIGHNIGYDLSVIDHEFSRSAARGRFHLRLMFEPLHGLPRPIWPVIRLIHCAIGRRSKLGAGIGLFTMPTRRLCFSSNWCRCCVTVGSERWPRQRRRFETYPARSKCTGLRDGYRRCGPFANNAPAIASVDGYPFRHRVRDVIRRQPIMLKSSALVSQAVTSLSEQSSGGAVLVQSQGQPIGLITASDFLRVQTLPEAQRPTTLSDMKAQTLQWVADDDFLYRALARIQRPGVEYLCVESRRGEVVGLVSAADLLLHRTSAAFAFGDEIETAKTVPGLGRAWARVPTVAESLLREDLESVDVAGIIAAEICALTARAAMIAEERMMTEGKGKPPVPLRCHGSRLRRARRQPAPCRPGHALFTLRRPGCPEDRWFAEAGSYMCEVLNEVGIPYCTGV